LSFANTNKKKTKEMGCIISLRINTKAEAINDDPIINYIFDVNEKCIYTYDSMQETNILKLPRKYFFQVPEHIEIYQTIEGKWYDKNHNPLLLNKKYLNEKYWLKTNGKMYKQNSQNIYCEMISKYI
jgi:hypothetical protein